MSENFKLRSLMVLIFVTLSCCFSLSSCGEKHAKLPNGYVLAPRDGNSVLLDENGRDILNGKKTSQFCVFDGCIYGWIDDNDDKFYFLNTVTHQLKFFDNWKDLDIFLERSGRPRLTMKESFTYLDIVENKKRITW